VADHPVDTTDHPWSRGQRVDPRAGRPMPGLLLVFTAGRAALVPIPLGARPIVVGRGPVGPIDLDDGALSRRHAEVALEGGAWSVRDLGSRNGTAVDARPLAGPLTDPAARLLRCGDTLFLLSRDLRPFVLARVEVEAGAVVGPQLKRVWDEIASIAARGPTLHIKGETGSGKELAARRFHQAGPRRGGRFVAVNCAAIPAAVAERLLFGARKGAYSGADADSDGHVQAADGGTLFLDEIAELEPAVQAKLLRVLESREVTPLGGARPHKVELQVCSASHGGLQDLVAGGRFREDLYFRVGRPEVRLPPLRERAEEIPWLIQTTLGTEARAHVSLVERALAEPWPGNVRELQLELREAARRAAADRSAEVEARHLELVASPEVEPAATRESLAAALAAHDGNISAAARALGVHRTQLRRWLERQGLAGKKE
jgi:transcriptional regulator of acetoin/glycerol metabolism